jgi:hypothetical protein
MLASVVALATARWTAFCTGYVATVTVNSHYTLHMVNTCKHEPSSNPYTAVKYALTIQLVMWMEQPTHQCQIVCKIALWHMDQSSPMFISTFSFTYYHIKCSIIIKQGDLVRIHKA